MSRSSPFQAVFFDFGGTLFSYDNPELSLRRILAALIERLGVQASRRELRDAYLTASRASALEFSPRPYYLHRELFEDTYRRVAEAFGQTASADLLRWCHEQQRERVLENFELRPGCIETLAALRGAGHHVSIVSNIDDDYLGPMLRRVGLDRVLDAWTSSEEARSCKPDPRIFRRALLKAKCSPGETLFVGDTLDADVGGARALGMTTVLLREGEALPSVPEATEDPHYTIEKLEEVLQIAQVA